MTTFAQDEASRQFNRPQEFYDIVLSTGPVYRIASGNRDLQIGSNVYTATASVRTDFVTPSLGNGNQDLTLSLPVDHAVVKRWFQMGVPPRQTTVTAWRKQERSQAIERQWIGLVTSISCDGNVAKLLIPAQIINNLQRFLPTVTTAASCPYILYDDMCQVNRDSFKITATAILVDGRDVRIDTGDSVRLGDWCVGGELVHPTSGERMTIAAQTDADPAHSNVTTLSMQMPIPDLKTGDEVFVYAGCDHSIQTCKNKFSDHHRFGGYPDAALINPFAPGGSGLGLELT